MCAQHKETEYLEIIFLADLADSEEVSERFGHFLIVDI